MINQRQIAAGDRVGICVERSVELMVGLLGILKAGAAYVPLNPALPTSRLSYMIADAGLGTVLTVAQLSAQLSDDANVLCDFADIAAYAVDADFVAPAVSVDAQAYVIYTSGTTGQPKGVELQHSALLDYCLFAQRRYYGDWLDGSLVATSPSFDMTIPGLYVPLLSGGCVELVATDDELTVLKNRLEDTQQHCLLRMTPMHVSALLSLFSSNFISQSRHVFVIGGDVFHTDLAIALQRVFPQSRLYNHYGPTEATVGCSLFDVTDYLEQAPQAGGALSIGRPMDNTHIYVLDDKARLLPAGAAGELCVGGDCLARGYLNRPELTAEKFIANPCYRADDASAPQRLYRTGDLVRWQDDGTGPAQLVYLGRIDHQVKIRGFRIEPDEIARQLQEHPEVDDALVVAQSNSQGQKSLVAYVVCENSAELNGDDAAAVALHQQFCTALRQHCALQLPDYMVPGIFVLLDALPLNANGKVDRKALPEADVSRQLSAYVAPVTPTETTLCEIWQQLLEIERVGTSDNFFALGGHSLLLVQMIALAHKQGLSLTARQVFDAGSLAELASVVDSHGDSPANAWQAPANLIPEHCQTITPQMLPLVDLNAEQIEMIARQVSPGAEDMANIQDIYPLGPLQQGVLFHHMMSEGHDPYTQNMLLRVHNTEALETLQQSLQLLINRHDVLRTAILWQGLDNPVQVVLRQAQLALNWLTADTLDEAQAMTLFKAQPVWMDLGKAPLLSMTAAALEVGYLVQVTFHHIVSDHVAMATIQQELQLIEAGRFEQLPEPVPYREFIAHTLHQAANHDAEHFFGELLGDVDETTAPFGLTDTQGDGRSIVEQVESVPQAVSQSIVQLSKSLQVSPAVVLHSAWALVIATACGRDDVVFGTVMSGRLQGLTSAQNMLGSFINTLPVRVKLAGQTAHSLVTQVRDRLYDLVPYEQASLAQAQQCSGLSEGPLFSAIFNYRQSSGAAAQGQDGVLDNGNVEFVEVQGGTNYPFNLSVDDLGGQFLLTMQIDSAVGCERVMGYMQTALAGLVEALSGSGNSPLVSGLTVMPQRERQQLLVDFNDNQVSYPNHLCIHQLFEQQVTSTPDAIAVVSETQQLSYAQLNRRANQVAHYLLNHQLVTPDTLVGLCVERSLDMMVGMLAILKAGGAYVPLDPDYPEARLQHMVDDAGVSVVLSQSALPSLFAMDGRQRIDLDCALFDSYSGENPDTASQGLKPSNLAYVIYTSGSTGLPKGVLIEHQSLVNSTLNRYQTYQSIDSFLLMSSMSFDSSVAGIFSTLCGGGKLCLPSQSAQQNIPQLIELLQNHGVSHFLTVPSLYQVLLEALDDGQGRCLADLVAVTVAGEACPASLVERHYGSAGVANATLYNEYGPTEATVWTTVAKLAPGQPVTIGKVIGNSRCYVLDEHRQPVALGVTGELYIGGAGLARGYLNQPALTEQRFIACPFSDKAGERIYRTGDLVRYLDDGQLVFVGRADDQVKIRGYRIELGEIENRLAQHPLIAASVVLAIPDAGGENRLVAYVMAADDCDLDEVSLNEQLWQHLRIALPDYMLPAAFVAIEQWPLTPNGKIDKKALPSPDALDTAGGEYVAPQTETEITLANIWADLLKLDADTISVNANFFTLGGHSLLAIRLITQIRQQLQLELQVKQLFDVRSLAELAALVEQESVQHQAWFDDSDELQQDELEITL